MLLDPTDVQTRMAPSLGGFIATVAALPRPAFGVRIAIEAVILTVLYSRK